MVVVRVYDKVSAVCTVSDTSWLNIGVYIIVNQLQLRLLLRARG
ncbi:Protein of unknown function [Pyronema omphalodes CBS 100304]|uniref:Uncharacterized protein n=1 Tax=Pyronema omphalodes (strain CBS 100304) TaxID=1076935 RepID=U4L3S5_PYROM|nr:Protein of unknown function [Pyronema omphalodes CBS 100304]